MHYHQLRREAKINKSSSQRDINVDHQNAVYLLVDSVFLQTLCQFFSEIFAIMGSSEPGG